MERYYRHKIENLLSVRKIVTIHYFEFDKNFVSEGESHDFWELVYADTAPIVCRRENEEIILQPGEMLFHKPNEYHRLSANGTDAPNVFIISFECKSEAIHFFEGRRLAMDRHYLRYIYLIIEESRKTFDLPYSDPGLRRMTLLPHPALGGMQLIRDLLEILLINVMRDEQEKSGAQPLFLPDESFGTRVSDGVTAYLRDHVSEAVRMEDLCRALHYNKSYLFRQFKTDTGKTIMRYHTELRITEAKRRLREGQDSVAAIAESLGFESANYFAKAFRRLSGCTPSEYRRRAKALRK